jgi:3',5'-cyclic AMP phosphodiesterase CpdA
MARDLQLLRESGKAPEPDAHAPIEVDPDALLTFAVWGDPQIAYWSALRSMRFDAACRDLANMQKPLDALILAGDITETGDADEFRMVGDILNTYDGCFRHFLCVPGNHDVRLRSYPKQLAVFNGFVRSVSGGIAGDDRRYYHAVRMRGYKFLLMGTDRASFEGAYISPRQLRWLDEQIAAENGKPVFVVNHQTLKGLNGLPVTWLGKGDWRGSVGWDSDKLRAVFEKHRNVIFLTGHLHYGTSRYAYEDCGAFKSLSVPTVGVVNHGDMSDDSQGYVLSVYADHIVARARVFGEGRYVDESVANARIEIPIEK